MCSHSKVNGFLLNLFFYFHQTFSQFLEEHVRIRSHAPQIFQAQPANRILSKEGRKKTRIFHSLRQTHGQTVRQAGRRWRKNPIFTPYPSQLAQFYHLDFLPTFLPNFHRENENEWFNSRRSSTQSADNFKSDYYCCQRTQDRGKARETCESLDRLNRR